MNILRDIELTARYSSPRTEKLYISVGGISCAVICRDIDFLKTLREHFGSFEPLERVAYEIILTLSPEDEFISENNGLTQSPTIRRMKSGNSYIITQFDNPFLAIANILSRKIIVKMPRKQDSFNSFFFMLFTLIMVEEKGLLLQGSAVSKNGRGNVLVGPSGYIKNSTDRFFHGRTLVANDLVLIKPHQNRYRVYSTPFQGQLSDTRANARAELSELYLLKKGSENNLKLLDNTRAAMELFQNALFFSNDNHLLNCVFRVCCSLADQVPVYKLNFLPGHSISQLIRDHNRS